MSTQEQFRQEHRPLHVRRGNEQVAESAKRHRFVARVPLLCECSEATCEEIFLLPLREYRELRGDKTTFLTVPGHAVAGALVRTRASECWVHDSRRGSNRPGERYLILAAPLRW